MPDLITTAELYTAMGVAVGDQDATTTAQLAQAIKGASEAVRRYTDRDFGTATVTQERTFEYDGSGFLDIPDCAAVTQVAFSFAGFDTILDSSDWTVQPSGATVFTWMTLPAQRGLYDPAMGFTRNADVIYRERGWLGTAYVKVTASWGWPTVPDDVKQAVIWTAAAMAQDPGAFKSESIAEYSYARDDSLDGGREPSGITERAKELLAPYLRIQIG